MSRVEGSPVPVRSSLAGEDFCSDLAVNTEGAAHREVPADKDGAISDDIPLAMTRSNPDSDDFLQYDRFGFSIEGSPTSAVARTLEGEPNCRSWDKYRAQLLEEGRLHRCRELKLLIRSGVPEEIRGRVWLSLSGADTLRGKYPPRYYQELIVAPTFKEQTVATGEIEKDLHRTFPGHRMFREEAGVAALRRVLVAYSLHDAEVGYCQSLNVLAALLLLFLDEVDAFWALAALLSTLLPRDYHSASGIHGVLADQASPPPPPPPPSLPY